MKDIEAEFKSNRKLNSQTNFEFSRFLNNNDTVMTHIPDSISGIENIQYFQIDIQNHNYIQLYKTRKMSKKLSSLFTLPFLYNYNTGTRKFITIAKVHNFLGYNFYSRLNSIYENLVEALAKKNYRYLEVSLENQLLLKVMKEMKHIEDGRFKFKIHSPDVKLTLKKKKKKITDMLPIRESVWNDGVIKIGVQCNVYFGERFNREDPLKKIENGELSKVYRIGQFRYIRYYPSMSIWQNVTNIYKQQTYQLLIKYNSKMYLSIQNYDQITTKSENISRQDSQLNTNTNTNTNTEIMTQIIMRTGNEKFDWIIVDINDINKSYRNSTISG